MSQVQFKPDTAWRKPARDPRGAPPTEVPQILIEYLELTYRRGSVCELPDVDENDRDTVELLRAARIYCDRKGRKFHYQFIEGEDGRTVLQFRMRDPRTYKRKAIR